MKMDRRTAQEFLLSPKMMNKMNTMFISGAISVAGKAATVVGRKVMAERSSASHNTYFIPHSVRMRAGGYVRDPKPAFLGKQWIPAKVLADRQAEQAALANRREHLARYGAVEAELKALWRANGVERMRGRQWGDIEMPPLPAEDPVCRPLPAGRLTPPQFREWVAQGFRNVRSAREAKRYAAYTDQLRLDYFAGLPDCVFAAAVKREANEAELRAYRAGKAAREAQAKIREEIRVKSNLRVDYQRQPQLYFRTRAEQIAEMKALGREVKALERKLAPAVVEVVLDDTLWRTSERGSWSDVVATGRVAKPVVIEITAEAKAEQEKKAKAERDEAERIARWKKMQTSEKTSASRAAWRHHKELVKQEPKFVEMETGDAGYNPTREMNY